MSCSDSKKNAITDAGSVNDGATADAAPVDSATGPICDPDTGVKVPGASADDDAGTPKPGSFTALYENVLRDHCGQALCHGAGSQNLYITTRDASYQSLVGVRAMGSGCGKTCKLRVVPGKPEQSLLYQKVQPRPSCGEQMPLGGSLPDDLVAQIKQWIADGAKND